MNIVILHFHFNRGGVTQVVLNQLRALDNAAKGGTRLPVAIVFGGRREGIADEQLAGFSSIDVSTHIVPGLEYDNQAWEVDPSLAGEIREVLAKLGFAKDETIIHVHNHCLGKNISLPNAIRRLAEEEFRFLLQLHDFAEDLRPANYRRLSETLASGDNPAEALYPQAPQIHYAVLNGRDFGILQSAEMVSDRLHQLPNAVGEFGEMPAQDRTREKLRERFGVARDGRLFVYPVRGIRRKNVGELLLWSAAGGSDTVFGMTLPPLNPVERKAYQHWTALARELSLRCVFEIGAPGGLEFKENLAAADALISTSIAEGFGMVFLETWLAGKSLVGRELPEITADFVEAGISFPGLAPQLLVPIDWVGEQDLRHALIAAYGRLLADYGITSLTNSEMENRVATLLGAPEIDFAALNGDLQTRVIRRVHGDPTARERLLALNPAMRSALSERADQTIIAQNAEIVRTTYSLAGCGRRLLKLYETILASDVSDNVHALRGADRILGAFLDISRLHPIRFEN